MAEPSRFRPKCFECGEATAFEQALEWFGHLLVALLKLAKFLDMEAVCSDSLPEDPGFQALMGKMRQRAVETG